MFCFVYFYYHFSFWEIERRVRLTGIFFFGGRCKQTSLNSNGRVDESNALVIESIFSLEFINILSFQPHEYAVAYQFFILFSFHQSNQINSILDIKDMLITFIFFIIVLNEYDIHK